MMKIHRNILMNMVLHQLETTQIQMITILIGGVHHKNKPDFILSVYSFIIFDSVLFYSLE